jgi:S1-C subfamily serine protease
MGNGIYSHFRMIIDYGRRRIIFVPTTRSSAPFPDHTSFGLTMVAGGSDLHTFSIASVRDGSPAESAGFHQGDIIAGVDDKVASQFVLSELRGWLAQEGQHHVFHVLRGQIILDVPADIHTVSVER